MLDVRLGELAGEAAIEAAGGVLWVDSQQSPEDATRAVRTLRPDLDGPTIARAVALAFGSPSAARTGRSANSATGRHRALAGAGGRADPARPTGDPATATRPPTWQPAPGEDRRPTWVRRARLLALAAAVMVVAPPIRVLPQPTVAEAATTERPGSSGEPPARRPPTARPVVRSGAPVQVPAPRPAATATRPVPPAAAAARPQPVSTPTVHPAAVGPTARPPGPARSTGPSQPPASSAPPASPSPTAPAGPIPTVVGVTCKLLPLPVCPTP